MTERPLIRQAYRFALEVHPEQEQLLLNFTGATRFFFNWALRLVKERLDQRAAGEDVAVPWSYKALCSEFSKVKDRVAPWRAEVVCGSQQAGLEQLGQALQAFSRARKAGRPAGFRASVPRAAPKRWSFSSAPEYSMCATCISTADLERFARESG